MEDKGLRPIIGKLTEVQAKLKAPKGQYNSFGKYKYRSCEDILEAVKPLLAERGLALALSDEPITEGTRTYIMATATLMDGADRVEVRAFAREPETKKGMDESQITGMASSYARKYALNGLFAIDDTKDADTMNNTGSDGLKDAITQIQAAKSVDELKAIHAKWESLQKNAKFKDALTRRKHEIDAA